MMIPFIALAQPPPITPLPLPQVERANVVAIKQLQRSTDREQTLSLPVDYRYTEIGMRTITIICAETSVKDCAKVKPTTLYHYVFLKADNWPLKCKDIARRHAAQSFRDSSGRSNHVLVFNFFFQ